MALAYFKPQSQPVLRPTHTPRNLPFKVGRHYFMHINHRLVWRECFGIVTDFETQKSVIYFHSIDNGGHVIVENKMTLEAAMRALVNGGAA